VKGFRCQASVFIGSAFCPGRMIPSLRMVTFASVFQTVMAPTSICLELTLLFVAWRCRLYRQLTFFSAYIVLVTVEELSGWWVSKTPWFYSGAFLYIYWYSQLVLSLLRLLTIAEIAKRSLRGYPAIWTLAWEILSAATLILLSWTTYSVVPYVHHVRRFIAVGGQRFELMQAILLLLVLVFGAYYHVRVPALYRLVLIGICIYSVVEVANSQMYLLRSALADSIFGYIRQGSYPISLAIWTYAVWRYGSSSNTPPELISQAAYDELSPQIHDRMRDLNDNLSDFMGKRRR
jgi:hypothetical protein